MVMALSGVALLVVGVTPRLWVARELRRQGRSGAVVMRPLLMSPMCFFGLCLLIGSVSAMGAGLFMVAWVSYMTVFLVTGLVRGAWRFPTAVRLIGDPEAWRGNRHAYWESIDGDPK
jgi:hypothetical protein